MNSDELKAAFRALPPREDDPDEQSWNHRAFRIREHVESDEIDLLLNWSTIEGTMFVGEAPYIQAEFDALLNEESFRWFYAIEESWFGNPPALSYWNRSSGNLVHQAYHLLQFEKLAEKSINDFNSIFEFGGGYGAMAYVINRLGYDGRYVIYDLPEMSLIQKYYLSNVKCSDVECTDVVEKAEYDLFIACYSLSEVLDLDFRRKVLDTVRAWNYLFAFVDVYSGVNNREFFWEFIDLSSLSWTLKRVPHRTFESCWYLIGS